MKRKLAIRFFMLKKSRLLLIFSLFPFLGISEVLAQEVLSSGGSTYKGSTVQLDWTVGEPIVETISSGSGALTQGFHQGNLTVTAIDQMTLGGIQLKVYPNPVSDQLMIGTEEKEMKNLSFMLYNVTGQLLLQKVIEQPVETVNMQAYVPGNYLLKVCSENSTPIQTFKIVKN
ncbi:MAG TPA: T9SS type A sorting domain-containing protein [Prolixibacteraceae bacterium]|nr:T9SS type A sorting domain-containing protein [Prolixibacteraceae bacterium]HPS13829.1 T9SS type A sorting domain-containing protein [Prolixibacteraceae bacterium]